MDIDNSNDIDKNEFISFMTKAFKNYEDNIEFLANDIRLMDDKIEEVKSKLTTIREKPTGLFVRNVPITNTDQVKDRVPLNKGSTLNIHILDADFLPEVFGQNFEPMITVLVNGGEQTEHTKAIKAPNNYTPTWKEILPFDIFKPNDEIEINIINAHP
jgi:Ca2+-dependent lipid-binding protein